MPSFYHDSAHSFHAPRLPRPSHQEYMSSESQRLLANSMPEPQVRMDRTSVSEEIKEMFVMQETRIMQGISPLLLDIMKQLKEVSQSNLEDAQNHQSMQTQLDRILVNSSSLAQRMDALELRTFNSDMEIVALRSKCRK